MHKKFARPYFIAEIGGNHDGSLQKAHNLVDLAAANGATAVKFQNFTVETLFQFDAYADIALKHSPHKRSGDEVREIIKKLSVPIEWFEPLKAQCSKLNVDLISAPYSLDHLEKLSQYVDAFKVGSGDLTWHEKTVKLQAFGKPVIISTGVSTLSEVSDLMAKLDQKLPLVLLQCTSNYEGGDHNILQTNLNVLKVFQKEFPITAYGLSDHQKSNVPIICSIALGGNVIERHFTDDSSQAGADHNVALEPHQWKLMVQEAQQAFDALGSCDKNVQDCETGTRISQRRSIWYARSLKSGHILTREDLSILRPRVNTGFGAENLQMVIGQELKKDVFLDQLVDEKDLV